MFGSFRQERSRTCQSRTLLRMCILWVEHNANSAPKTRPCFKCKPCFPFTIISHIVRNNKAGQPFVFIQDLLGFFSHAPDRSEKHVTPDRKLCNLLHNNLTGLILVIGPKKYEFRNFELSPAYAWINCAV